jgi:hypothetical protein
MTVACFIVQLSGLIFIYGYRGVLDALSVLNCCDRAQLKQDIMQSEKTVALLYKQIVYEFAEPRGSHEGQGLHLGGAGVAHQFFYWCILERQTEEALG